jgi:fatty acid-binding protein DegV
MKRTESLLATWRQNWEYSISKGSKRSGTIPMVMASGRLYATQVSALNDSKETEYATDLFKEEVKKAILENGGKDDVVSFF